MCLYYFLLLLKWLFNLLRALLYHNIRTCSYNAKLPRLPLLWYKDPILGIRAVFIHGAVMLDIAAPFTGMNLLHSMLR